MPPPFQSVFLTLLSGQQAHKKLPLRAHVLIRIIMAVRLLDKYKTNLMCFMTKDGETAYKIQLSVYNHV